MKTTMVKEQSLLSRNRTYAESLCEGFGGKLRRVSADGNCFYRAMVAAMGLSRSARPSFFTDWKLLKEKAVETLVSSRKVVAPFLEEFAFDEYLERQRQPGAWADYC